MIINEMMILFSATKLGEMKELKCDVDRYMEELSKLIEQEKSKSLATEIRNMEAKLEYLQQKVKEEEEKEAILTSELVDPKEYELLVEKKKNLEQDLLKFEKIDINYVTKNKMEMGKAYKNSIKSVEELNFDQFKIVETIEKQKEEIAELEGEIQKITLKISSLEENCDKIVENIVNDDTEQILAEKELEISSIEEEIEMVKEETVVYEGKVFKAEIRKTKKDLNNIQEMCKIAEDDILKQREFFLKKNNLLREKIKKISELPLK